MLRQGLQELRATRQRETAVDAVARISGRGAARLTLMVYGSDGALVCDWWPVKTRTGALVLIEHTQAQQVWIGIFAPRSSYKAWLGTARTSSCASVRTPRGCGPQDLGPV